jgi:sugar phosphate isomerase/epimerase
MGCQSRASAGRPAPAQPLFSISLAEWSLHRALQAGQMTNLDFPVVARRDHAIGAVEYVNSFFKDKARDQAYLKELNLRCADQGVESLLIMVDGEGPLAEPNPSARKQAIENHRRWIEAARTLGCHAIRVNAAGSGPAEEQQRCAADSLTELAEVDRSISVIVENHGGNSSNGAWLAGVMRLAAHPRVGTLPDFGNFHLGNDVWYDRYQGVRELMPFAKAVSAKSYDFDEHGDCKETDYRRMLRIVVAAGYHGFVGIEYEGTHHTEPEGIGLTKRLLERVRGELTNA